LEWSHSAHVAAHRCQLQFVFGHVMAAHNARDPERREAYVLKQLQQLPAWRGSIIHRVLSTDFLAALLHGRSVDAATLAARGHDLARRQFAFSAERRYRDADLSKGEAGEDYCALVEHERGRGVTTAQLTGVLDEITRAFDHLVSQTAFLAELRRGRGHTSEPRLSFRLDGTTIVARPDLVFVRSDGAPVVIDWKIGASDTSDYSRQLLTYALAVARSGRWSGTAAKDVRLYEANLLKNEIREHPVTAERLDEAEEFIYRSVVDMRHLLGEGKFDDLDLSEFEVAGRPTTCAYCNFAELCVRRLADAGRTREVLVIQGRLL